MDIMLTPELEEAARQKVASGEYETLNDLVNVAVRHLLEPDEFDTETDELRQEVAIGLEQFQRGEYRTFDRSSLKALGEEIKANSRRKREQS